MPLSSVDEHALADQHGTRPESSSSMWVPPECEAVLCEPERVGRVSNPFHTMVGSVRDVPSVQNCSKSDAPGPNTLPSLGQSLDGLIDLLLQLNGLFCGIAPQLV